MVFNQPTLPLALSVLVLVLAGESCFAFVVPSSTRSTNRCLTGGASFLPTRLFSTPDEEEGTPDEEGADLAAQFFQMAQAKGISIDEDDLVEEEEDLLDEMEEEEEYSASMYGYNENFENNDDEDDDEEPNIPQGAIDAFVGYDSSDVNANPTVDISNDQLYSELEDRVLDTAGGFVEMTRGAVDDDDDFSDDGTAEEIKEYVPPTTVPDAELTAGEVVLLVLKALQNNDNPHKDRGLEILFGYSSPKSQIKNERGLTPADYGAFWKDTDYNAMFEHLDATIEKGEYSPDGKTGFFTARLQTGLGARDSIPAKFVLSSVKDGDDSFWLVDSILIRPPSARRKRR